MNFIFYFNSTAVMVRHTRHFSTTRQYKTFVGTQIYHIWEYKTREIKE